MTRLYISQRRHWESSGISALSSTRAEQEHRVLLPFIKEGLERGEKAFHIVDPDLRDQRLANLQAAWIDTLAEEHDGQLDVRG